MNEIASNWIFEELGARKVEQALRAGYFTGRYQTWARVWLARDNEREKIKHSRMKLWLVGIAAVTGVVSAVVALISLLGAVG